MGDSGRSGTRYLKLCAKVRARRDPCGLCGQPIDYNAEPCTPWSFSLDHIISLAHGGGLLDERNAQAAHFGCNSAKGGSTRRGKPERRVPVVVRTSRRW